MALISLKPFAQRRHVGHQDRMLWAAPVSAGVIGNA
jgi:hypothetical protein